MASLGHVIGAMLMWQHCWGGTAAAFLIFRVCVVGGMMPMPGQGRRPATGILRHCHGGGVEVTLMGWWGRTVVAVVANVLAVAEDMPHCCANKELSGLGGQTCLGGVVGGGWQKWTGHGDWFSS